MRHLITAPEYRQMPWKNGQGTTAEIERFPEDGDRYLWRLSQATIRADGAFSEFPGFDRWLAVIRGDAVLLNDHRLEPNEPFRFEGEKKIECRLTGKEVLDVGLIFDRALINAEMQIAEGLINPGPGIHYFIDLATLNTLKVEDEPGVKIQKSLWITVTPVTHRSSKR